MPKKLKIKFEEIQASALFAGVPPKIIKKIALFPRAQEHPAGDIIIKEGDIGEFMFVVLSGQVDVVKQAGDKEILLATLPPGVFVGEGALVSGAPRNATVKAKTPVKIAYFDRTAYNKMIMIDPAISATLMKVHKERCKDQIKKVNNVLPGDENSGRHRQYRHLFGDIGINADRACGDSRRGRSRRGLHHAGGVGSRSPASDRHSGLCGGPRSLL